LDLPSEKFHEFEATLGIFGALFKTKIIFGGVTAFFCVIAQTNRRCGWKSSLFNHYSAEALISFLPQMLKGIIEKVGRLSNTIFPRIVTLKGGKNSSKLLD